MFKNFYDIDEKLLEQGKIAEKECEAAFAHLDEICEYNSAKVLRAFSDNKISEAHLRGTTGYGYDDRGRDALDKVYASAFGCEDALVRHNFVSGTHALSTMLFGVLRPGDTLLSITGAPYDTLEEVIGIKGDGNGSLKDFGIHYKEIPLKEDGGLDTALILSSLDRVKMVYLQRSRGYSQRPSISVEVMKKLFVEIRKVRPDVIIAVDNCYGEFVETLEPTDVGADLIAGSLIKNPGGGIARTGGYIAGRASLIELCAFRLTTPGTGKEVGPSLSENENMYQGFFMAPSVVNSALKTAIFASALFERLGFEVSPTPREKRTDIIQSIALGSEEKLSAFCEGIQSGAAIDSFVTPTAWDMPGYDSKIIMAAGAFHMGASIELSADAPIREPFSVFLQGGITYPSGKLGVILAAETMRKRNLLF